MVQNADTLPSPDNIAEAILTTFDALPSKYKPRALPHGKREWAPLAGIVVVKGQYLNRVRCLLMLTIVSAAGSKQAPSNATRADTQTQCVAIATGMKCLPRDKICLANGNTLHDWHAEVLAIRGFNRWIIDECNALTLGNESVWLQWRSDHTQSASKTPNPAHPFELKPDVDIHMYVSSAPCGDASMELIMAAQSDAAPWTAPAPSAAPGDMLGRGHFDQLGIVRRKPSRQDAPGTWSKSCSDKLAMKQCTGLLSGLTAKLVHPGNVYIKSLILPEAEVVSTSMQRAFSETGRMRPVLQDHMKEQWMQHGYAFKPFNIATTRHLFAFRKTDGAASSNLASIWTPHRQEALVNGVLTGRKQFDPRGASCVSRRVMWQAVVKVAVATGMLVFRSATADLSYGWSKHDAARNGVKEDVKKLALHDWRRNDGDDGWKLEFT